MVNIMPAPPAGIARGERRDGAMTATAARLVSDAEAGGDGRRYEHTATPAGSYRRRRQMVPRRGRVARNAGAENDRPTVTSSYI